MSPTEIWPWEDALASSDWQHQSFEVLHIMTPFSWPLVSYACPFWRDGKLRICLSCCQHLRTRILQVWDLKDLGIQASQRIAQASDPLQSLADISQNFPNLASVLSAQKSQRSTGVNWSVIRRSCLEVRLLLLETIAFNTGRLHQSIPTL